MRHFVRLGGAIGLVHAGEDIILMSLGRWLPVPVWALFLIGIILSTGVLTVLIQKLTIRLQ